MKIIHGDGYSISELNSFKVKYAYVVYITKTIVYIQSTIYTNLLMSTADVVKAMNKLSIPFDHPSNEVSR